jgi:hypothetical protein
MEEKPKYRLPILEVAWTRYAEYDAAAQKRKNRHYSLRKWVAYISVLATVFAILSVVFPQYFPTLGDQWQDVIRYILIVLPILSATLAAFTSKFYPGTDWLVLRAGAEQIMREIYLFRTTMKQKTDKQRLDFETRLKEIQAQVYTGLNGEMVLDPYTGPLPPVHDNGRPRTDEGFEDLSAATYYKLRVEDQLKWHRGRVNRMHVKRVMWQVGILFMGAVGSFLAAVGGELAIWVALATAITTAMIGWQEIQNLDMTVRNYSKVILDLNSIATHWQQLDDNDRAKKKEFHAMVNETESVLWNQNLEYIKAMQEAYENAKDEEEEESEAERSENANAPVAVPALSTEGGSG